MHENVPALYPNPETSAKVVSYAAAKSTPLPDWLLKYHEWGCSQSEIPEYLISTFEAELLVMLTKLAGVKRVLELGVYVGFSGMVWSHAVGKDGKVVGLELSEKYANIAKKGFADNGVDNVEVKVGDAVESLAALEVSEPFDLIFLDANKEAYSKYLELILKKSQPGQANRLLKPGGLIVADNVLQRAVVANPTASNPNYTKNCERKGAEMVHKLANAVQDFNDKALSHSRLEVVVVPLYDGVSLARLLD